MYQYSQKARQQAISIVLVALFFSFLVFNGKAKGGIIAIYSALITVLIVRFALFYKMDIRIDEQDISINFGNDLIKRKISLSDIESCFPVTSWISSWNISRRWGYTQYGLPGKDSVELTFKNGKRTIRISSQETDKLCEAINQKLKK